MEPEPRRSGPETLRRGDHAIHDPEGVLRPMKKFSSVAAYLKTVPPAPRAALQQLRQTIKAAAPKATELISYGIPAFQHHGMLVYYAAFKDHCSLFGVSGAIVKPNRKALAHYEMS